MHERTFVVVQYAIHYIAMLLLETKSQGLLFSHNWRSPAYWH